MNILEQKIIKFAKKEFKINLVLKKTDPKTTTYYMFYNPPEYDDRLQDRLTDLDIELAKKTEKCIEFFLFPQKLIDESEFKEFEVIYSINS